MTLFPLPEKPLTSPKSPSPAPKPEKEPYFRRYELQQELRKQSLGITPEKKQKIIGTKYGQYITRLEIKKIQKELKGSHQAGFGKTIRALKDAAKKLK